MNEWAELWRLVKEVCRQERRIWCLRSGALCFHMAARIANNDHLWPVALRLARMGKSFWRSGATDYLARLER
jgi:hypothetical protein